MNKSENWVRMEAKFDELDQHIRRQWEPANNNRFEDSTPKARTRSGDEKTSKVTWIARIAVFFGVDR